jgi:hypothetical protein
VISIKMLKGVKSGEVGVGREEVEMDWGKEQRH